MGDGSVWAQFRRNALEPPSPILLCRTAKTSLLSRTTHLRTSYCFPFSRRLVKPRISKPKGPKVTTFGQPFWICSKPAQNDRKSAICGLQIGSGQSLCSVALAKRNAALGTRMASAQIGMRSRHVTQSNGVVVQKSSIRKLPTIRRRRQRERHKTIGFNE